MSSVSTMSSIFPCLLQRINLSKGGEGMSGFTATLPFTFHNSMNSPNSSQSFLILLEYVTTYVMQSVLKRQQRAVLGRRVAYHFVHTPSFAFTRIGVVYFTFVFLVCRTNFTRETSGVLIMFASMCAHHCPLQKGKEEGRLKTFKNFVLSFLKKLSIVCRYPTLFCLCDPVLKFSRGPPRRKYRSEVTSLRGGGPVFPSS